MALHDVDKREGRDNPDPNAQDKLIQYKALGTTSVSPVSDATTASSQMAMKNSTISLGQAAYNFGTGFWMGLDTDSIAKLSIGNYLGNSLTWDGTNLNITGAILAGSGTIGGFTIGNDYVRDSVNSFGLASTVTGGDDVRFWAGDTFANRAIAPFRVTEAGSIVATDIQVAGINRRSVSPSGGDDTSAINSAISALSSEGGGILTLTTGTYTLSGNIALMSKVAIVGDKESGVILDFNSTAHSLAFSDTSVYTTGTITSITSGVNVTGSGTSWLANASAGQYLFIGNRHYQIAAVTSDTTLILAEGYIGNASLPGASYRISTILTDVDFAELTIKNSTASGMNIRGCKNITLTNMTFYANNVGINWNYVTENEIRSVVVASSTSDGVQMTNVGFGNTNALASVSNGGNGYTLNGCETMPFLFCATNANTGDGINATSVVKSSFTVESRANGGQGVEFVSGCNNNFLTTMILANNTSDGLKLTASSDKNIISGCNFDTNGGYGINIAASSCDNTILSSNEFTSNTSGTYSDSGTGTIIAADLSSTQALTHKDLTSGTNTFPTFNQNTTGSAATLTTGRTIKTDLTSTSAATFDGSANITPGVSGNLPLANGGTGASLSDPAANTLMGWDDTDNAVKFITIGTNLSYDHTSHTLSATGGGGTGDVTGPASSTSGDIATFSGTTGKIIQDSGKALPSGAIVGDSDSQTLSNKTLTNPKTNGIYNSAGTQQLGIGGGSSDVNYINIAGTVTGSAPILSATGSDSNVSLRLATKGSGTVQANGVNVATISDTQVLTNKDVSSSTNTFAAANIVPTGSMMPYAAASAPTGWLMCDGSGVSRTTYATLFNLIAPSKGTFTVTIASPAVVTLTAHGMATGDAVYLTTTGALPTGLSANTLYYVIKIDANTFNLATSRANALAGTKINTSGSQSGTHTLVFCPYGLGDGSTTFNVPDLKGRAPIGSGTGSASGATAWNLGSQPTSGAGGEQTHTLSTSEMPSHAHGPSSLAFSLTDNAVSAASGANWFKPADHSTSTANAGSGGAHNIQAPVSVVNFIIKT